MTARRCILLFARSANAEARTKGLRDAEVIFALAERRIRAAARALKIDLVIADQRGATFGERLENAFADARARGYQQIVAVGNDTPGVRTGHFVRAFAALQRHAVVLGPSDDGGVYLIGAALPIERCFSRVRWKTRSTRADLAAIAGAVLLERLADVDRTGDLERLDARGDRLLALVLVAIRARPPIPEALPRRSIERIGESRSIRGPPR